MIRFEGNQLNWIDRIRQRVVWKSTKNFRRQMHVNVQTNGHVRPMNESLKGVIQFVRTRQFSSERYTRRIPRDSLRCWCRGIGEWENEIRSLVHIYTMGFPHLRADEKLTLPCTMSKYRLFSFPRQIFRVVTRSQCMCIIHVYTNTRLRLCIRVCIKPLTDSSNDLHVTASETLRRPNRYHSFPSSVLPYSYFFPSFLKSYRISRLSFSLAILQFGQTTTVHLSIGRWPGD